MVDEDYSLVSTNEVSELKQDVDYLKRNPLGGTQAGKNLQEGIEKLNSSINELIEIFKEAGEQMKAEERESDVIAQRIAPIEKKLDELADQNQKIAKGILAVADMVAQREKQMMMPRPQQRPMQPRPQPMQPQMPRPMMPQPQMQMQPKLPPIGSMPIQPAQPMPQMQQLPPLNPPKKEEKKGLFGLK